MRTECGKTVCLSQEEIEKINKKRRVFGVPGLDDDTPVASWRWYIYKTYTTFKLLLFKILDSIMIKILNYPEN